MNRLISRLRRPFLRHRGGSLVDFLICGTQKGGTTALDAYLREHPEISMSVVKEVHFFDDERYFRDATPDYSHYHSWFRPKGGQRSVGEASPSYMYWYDAPRRIWEYNPEMKLIVVLRNPIERAYSHWTMERHRKRERLSFWDAIRTERERCREALPYQHRYFSYVDRGFYMEQLRRLWFFFSPDRVLVLKNEYLRNNPGETLREVCDFLEIGRLECNESKDVHSSHYDVDMGGRERDYLRYTFEYEISALERALGWDCTDWV